MQGPKSGVIEPVGGLRPSVYLSICVCMYIYIYTYVTLSIYIYRHRKLENSKLAASLCIEWPWARHGESCKVGEQLELLLVNSIKWRLGFKFSEFFS